MPECPSWDQDHDASVDALFYARTGRDPQPGDEYELDGRVLRRCRGRAGWIFMTPRRANPQE